MVWMYMNSPTPTTQVQNSKKIIETDSSSIAEKKQIIEIKDSNSTQNSLLEENKFGKIFSPFAKGNEKIFRIETKHYIAEFSSKGGMIKKFELKEYNNWNKKKLVQLIQNGGDFSISFKTSEGKIINSSDLFFEIDQNINYKLISDSEKFVLEFELPISEKNKITQKYIFDNSTYGFSVEHVFTEMQDIIVGNEYQIMWNNGIKYSEFNSVDEASFSKAVLFSGGELSEIDATSTEIAKENFSGNIDFVAITSKYFGVALIPNEKKSDGGFLSGKKHEFKNGGINEKYSIGLSFPLKKNLEKNSLQVFIGPLKKNILSSYKNIELDKVLNLGATWIIRPISEYFILPLFSFLHSFIQNFGVVLIVFSIIIKIVLHPLTQKSSHSMKKMQKLQPIINEIKEKHKDEPTKMNQMVMKTYSEYGVNPAGGCLPLIFQMPILFSLFAVFSSTIELRQANFIWWINDLSIPDKIFELPFTFPIFGFKNISGLALLMGITMFIQQKQTVTDPRQKMMVWMMPILMTFMFNNFPAGLNLYYFLFNLLSIAQQSYINKQHEDEPLVKIDPKNRKASWIEKWAKEMEKKSKSVKR